MIQIDKKKYTWKIENEKFLAGVLKDGTVDVVDLIDGEVINMKVVNLPFLVGVIDKFSRELASRMMLTGNNIQDAVEMKSLEVNDDTDSH